MAPKDAPQTTLASLIQDIDGGDFHSAATRQMTQLLATMFEVERNTGGSPKGKLTITLGFDLEKTTLDISASVKVVEPSKVNGRIIMFGSQDGALLKEDPRQGILQLGRGEPRDATPDLRDR